MLVEFECPECKSHICERWGTDGSTLGIRLMYWHMFLNPGIAINELLLGQRTPKNLYVCKSCSLPLLDRSYVHCRACETFHNGRIWSQKNAFGNWFGYVCPSCGGSIECLWNLTSYAVLALTAPLWLLPAKRLRAKHLAKQLHRITPSDAHYVDVATQAPKPVDYGRMGWLFGLLLNLFTGIYPVIVAARSHELSWWELVGVYIAATLLGLIICLPGGWLFGFGMKMMLEKRGNTNTHLTYDSEGVIVPSSLISDIDKQTLEKENL